MTGDMADLSMGKEAAKFTIAEFGQIDGLILNHGTLSPVTRVSDSEAEDWKQSFDVNFFSCVAFVSLVNKDYWHQTTDYPLGTSCASCNSQG